MWRQIPTLSKNKSRSGYDHKLVAARELAVRHGCQGTIAVVDRDRTDGTTRLDELNQGRARCHANGSPHHPISVGVAVESIEAWTLGDAAAIASVLEISVEVARQCYQESKVEDLYENSGKPERHPKTILEKVAQLKHPKADVIFRAEVAEKTNLNALRRHCPKGFVPFEQDLRENFQPKQDETVSAGS